MKKVSQKLILLVEKEPLVPKLKKSTKKLLETETNISLKMKLMKNLISKEKNLKESL